MLPGLTTRRSSHIIRHLSRDLTPDAAPAWERVELDEPELHNALHSELGKLLHDLRSTRNGVSVHAGSCVLDSGVGVLIPGPSGCGKSTLVAALALERSAASISDDTTWIDGEVLTGVGAPAALRASSPYFERARQLWYATDEQRLMARFDDLGAPVIRLSGTLDLIVFPQFGGELATVRLHPAQAVARLISAVHGPVGLDELQALAEVASLRPAYRISYADLDGSMRAFDDALSESAGVTSSACHAITTDELGFAGLSTDVGGVSIDGCVVLWSASAGRVVLLEGCDEVDDLDESVRQSLGAAGFLDPTRHTRRDR